jgi:hypothetical protein
MVLAEAYNSEYRPRYDDHHLHATRAIHAHPIELGVAVFMQVRPRGAQARGVHHLAGD